MLFKMCILPFSNVRLARFVKDDKFICDAKFIFLPYKQNSNFFVVHKIDDYLASGRASGHEKHCNHKNPSLGFMFQMPFWYMVEE